MSAPFLRPGHYGSVVGDDPALGYADAENVEAYGGVLVAESISSLAMARAIMAVLPAVEVCRALARMEWRAPDAEVWRLAVLAARVVRCADTGRPDGLLMLGPGHCSTFGPRACGLTYPCAFHRPGAPQPMRGERFRARTVPTKAYCWACDSYHPWGTACERHDDIPVHLL